MKNNFEECDKEALAKAIRCLVNTAYRTTDLNHIYNDTNGESISWEDLGKLCKNINLDLGDK